jgi:adenosylhomocysteine nucleosidase
LTEAAGRSGVGCDDGAVVVGVLAAMASELRAFVRASELRSEGDAFVGVVGRHQVRATTMGVGMTGAARATERLLDGGDVDRVVVVGIAGGLDTTLPIGHVVVPEVVADGVTGAEYRTTTAGATVADGRLVTFDSFQTDAGLMAQLQLQGFVAIDMETAAVAAVCEPRGCPLTVFRAISDNATDGSVDAAVAAMARPDGSPDLGAALRYGLRRPWRTPRLMALGRDAHRAARAAAEAATAALAAEPEDDAPP